MDAENDNDQPNSSSASASSSSSNNSSSSNLLGHLPMLPFMRSTDDDEPVADGEEEAPAAAAAAAAILADGNAINDLHEEPMPLQSHVTAAATAAAQTASAFQPQPTLAPITTTASTSATANATATASTAATINSSSTGREEPMVGAEQLAVMTSSSASSLPPPPSSYASSSASSSSSSSSLNNSYYLLPRSAFLPSANPAQVIFSPFLFNNPFRQSNDDDYEISPPSPAPPFPPSCLSSAENLCLDTNNFTAPLPLSTTLPLPSDSASVNSSPSSSTASSSLQPTPSSSSFQFNLDSASQLSLAHEQTPIPTSLFSVSFQQQHHPTSSLPPPPIQLQQAPNIETVEPQSALPPPLSTQSASASSSSSATLQQQEFAAADLSQSDQEHQLTAQINRSDIADTIDASAVIVHPLEVIPEQPQHPHLYPQEAANSSEELGQLQPQNDIHLDDNDNNDFDVDLNLRNDATLATTTTTNHHHHQRSEIQQTLSHLDTSASGSAGPSSSSGQQQQASQTPATLPLLLQQQQQVEEEDVAEQASTEEANKHLPSFDHHYHNNPNVYHHHNHNLHSNSYQQHSSSSSALPFTYRQSNGAHHSATNNNLYGNTMSSSNRNHGSASGQLGNASTSNGQVVDRIKLLYPNVNEDETPLPRCWSAHEKCLSIGLSQNNLRVHFKGKQSNDAASVRTAHPIPTACGIYYFEVKIISKGKNGYMGIGLTAQQFRMNRLPGWDKQSYGYHGDDGNSFSSSGHGQSYGPTFTTGDIIGCCVNFVNNTCFYTKNGVDLGIAFRELPTRLYPTVGLQTPGEEVDANFGQEPFKFTQIEDMMKQMRGEVNSTIYDFPLPAEQGDPTTLLQKMVHSYLVHNGYSQTAEAFGRQKPGQNQKEDMTSIRNRQKILKLVMSGKMGQAIDQTMRTYPGILENNKNLLFMLKCRQFIEMINGSDVENGNEQNNTSNGIVTAEAVTSTAAAATITTATTTNTTTNNSSSNITNSTTITTTTINNAQNSSHITVINTDNDLKTQNNINEHCNNSKDDASITISKSNNDNDYLNDVEMENNGHTNGNICKNGNANNINDSLDADEEMDVDVAPSVKKYSHGIERILEFGKELSQMGQQLEKENKMTDEERQMLEDAFSLIAYSNPWASPLGWQLCPTKRETVCRSLNSAILESMNYPRWSPMEYCVAHANELLKVMSQSNLGSCAFINITDVFPQN